IDESTGVGVTNGLSGVSFLNSLAQNSVGKLYSVGGSSGNMLVTIDPVTGLATTVTPLTVSGFNALAFSSNDVLYAKHFTSAGLYRINITNGVASLVGNTSSAIA